MTAVAPAVVHESDRTRVTRLSVGGRTVVRKQPLGTDAQRRLRHEVGMLERLRGVEGVARLVDAPQDPVLDRDGGRGLHEPRRAGEAAPRRSAMRRCSLRPA